MSVTEAASILGFATIADLTVTTVKSRFRSMSMKCHPDHGGDAAAFVRLKEAFTVLSDVVKEAQFRGFIKEATTTVSGELLKDLGRGHPITVNAKECGTCSGLGYLPFKDHGSFREFARYRDCTLCQGTGGTRDRFVVDDCRRCDATGVFTVNGKPKGVCRACNGRKFHARQQRVSPLFSRYNSVPHRCAACVWRQEKEFRSDVKHYQVCDVCKGVGETKLFNPALPKGYLT